MKHFYTPLVFLISIFLFQSTSAQDESLVKDFLFISNQFVTPAAQGAAYQAGAGWFTSAQALEPWKFEVSLHANGLVVPSSKKEFSVSNRNDLDYLSVNDGNNARVPTAYGGQTDVYYRGNGIEFQALEGAGKGVVLHAFPQITVGLPFETEIVIRALPELTLDDVSFRTYGAGIKHNFSQYFKFNNPEDLQVSALITYSQFDVGYGFTPIALEGVETSLDRVDVDADIWMFEALASRRYEEFEVFGALGVITSNFDYGMGGDGAFLQPINSALTTLGDSEFHFKGDIGFNYYFGDFKVSTMATAGRFFNVNIGLHFRI